MSSFHGYPHRGPYPHEGGCASCAELRVCNVCGAPFPYERPDCTNGRCMACHDLHCSSGGDTTPGHGFWRRPFFTDPLEDEAAAAVAAGMSGRR